MNISARFYATYFVLSAILSVFCLLLTGSCKDESGDSGGSAKGDSKREVTGVPAIIATIPPLAMILRELAGEEFEVKCLLSPGSSPHTYEPSPSDAKLAASASAMFFVGEGLDNWAIKLETRKKVEVFQFVPDEYRLKYDDTSFSEHADHNHSKDHLHPESGFDPHFWTSPKTVIPVAISLSGELTKLNPGAQPVLRENLKRFELSLLMLDAEILEKLSGFKGDSVILLHASQNYLLNDCGIQVAGIVEESAGAEASPKKIAELAKQIRESKAKAIFTEPQLSNSAARTLAKEAGVPLYELDPLGGKQGRDTYEQLIRFNISKLAEALGGL